MAEIQIIPINAAFISVQTADEGIREDLYQYMRCSDPTFVKSTYSKWDGEVRFYDKKTGKISYGLLGTILTFCKERDYTIEIDPDLKRDISPVERPDVQEWVDNLKIMDKDEVIKPYDYQVEGLYLSCKYSRMTLLAATSAGKSLLQYLIIRYNQKAVPGRILLVVPSINLVTQMYEDFKNYSSDDEWDVASNCHRVHEGISPYTNKSVVISTWQSLKDLPPDYFYQFSTLLGDECHLFSGASLESIGKNCINAYNRIGLTGTLKNNKMHPLQVQQHFGTIKRIVTTKQLQDAGRAAKTKITMFQIEHTTADRKKVAGMKYQEEMDFIMAHPYRNKLIKGLAKTLKGNSLFLFDRIEAHLEIIAEELRHEMPGKRIMVITGNVENDDRQIIKAEMEAAENGGDIVLLASYGTLSTGVSIKQLHNLVFCHPSKSIIRVLQSIGRILRLHATKDIANVYDICDIFMYSGSVNYCMTHAGHRLQFYQSEQHPIFVKKLIAT